MTREEAAEKVSQAYGIVRGGMEFVKAIEALGLIKFDDVPKFDNRDILICSSQFHNEPVIVKVYKAIEALIKMGYKVEKNV